MRGSWPPLLLAAAAFMSGLLGMRARSTLLAIERDAEPARQLAARYGTTVADAFAWRDLLGADASHERWERALAAFAAERHRLGDALAVVAIAGDRGAALAAREAGADAAAAWQRFRPAAAALPGLRYLAMRDRFAARAAARE